MIRHNIVVLTFICISIIFLSGCSQDNNVLNESINVQDNTPIENQSPQPTVPIVDIVPETDIKSPEIEDKPDQGEVAVNPLPADDTGQIDKSFDNGADVEVLSEPESITALVNKQYSLPKDYEPSELVYPEIDFIFSEKLDKRKLRKEAAEAVADLFAGAAEDDTILLGVSAYRSNATQKALFERYVKRDGEDKARTFSAVPGHSEHETGLAIDVTGGNGKCAAMSCFGDTKEAAWLEEHAAEYGFVIRYPEGKQDITGYIYEPWHLRYVGVSTAQEISSKNITLEEYFDAIAVSQ